MQGAATDTCNEMYWTIVKRLFPHLHVALREIADSDLTDERARQILTEALSREEWHGNAYDERAKSYADSDSIMGSAGLSVLPRSIETAIVSGLEAAEEEGRDISDELEAIAIQRQVTSRGMRLNTSACKLNGDAHESTLGSNLRTSLTMSSMTSLMMSSG